MEVIIAIAKDEAGNVIYKTRKLYEECISNHEYFPKYAYVIGGKYEDESD